MKKQIKESKRDIREYDCCFCLNIVVDPISLKCTKEKKHSFCLKCMEDYLQSVGNVFALMEGKKEEKVTIKCPTCRKQHLLDVSELSKEVDRDLVEEIRLNFEKEYVARRKEVIEEGKVMALMKKDVRRVAIGNSYKRVKKTDGEYEKNVHKWVCFARIEGEKHPEKYIESVKFELHPTFRPSVIELDKPNLEGSYEISRLGWGTFDIPVTIKFKKNLGLKPYTQEHELVFSGSGAYHSYDVLIPNSDKDK